jgi:CO/xanthine dehydrogenase Mo-binding subunit
VANPLLPPLPPADLRRRAANEVHFAATTDTIGPLGAKSMSENPFNPTSPALRDATGVRFTRLPLARDTVWLALRAGGT